MLYTRKNGFVYHTRRILVLVLAIAMLGMYIVPAQAVFAGEIEDLDDAVVVTTMDALADGTEEPAPPADDLDPVDDLDSGEDLNLGDALLPGGEELSGSSSQAAPLELEVEERVIEGDKKDATMTYTLGDWFIIVHGVGVGSNKYFDITIYKNGVLQGEADKRFLVQESGSGDTVIDYMGITIEITLHGNDMVDSLAKAKITFKVTYDGNGADFGTTPGGKEISVDEDVIVFPTAPTKEGYIFKGWNYNGQLYQPGAKILKPNTNINFVAEWEEIAEEIVEETFTVTYAPGTQGTFLEQKTEGLHSGDSTPEAPAVTGNPGYMFTGWTPDPGATVTSDATYVAQWAAISYYVSYDANGGSGAPVDNNNYNLNNTVTVLDGIPVWSGHTFEGWLCNGIIYEAGETFTMPAADVTLVAQWDTISYYISYDANGGNGAPVDNNAYDAGNTVLVLDSVPVLAGHTFEGWLYNEAIYEDGDTFTMPAGSVTLTAQWSAVDYVVTYVANGGAGTMADTPAAYNQNVRLRNNSFTRSGYTFTGWNTQRNGKGTSYSNLYTFKPWTRTANLTVYAQWTPAGGGSPDVPPVVVIVTPAGGPGEVPPQTAPVSSSTILEEGTPQSAPPTPIISEPAPLANFAAWALLNLILTIVTGVIMVMLLVDFFFRKKSDLEDDPDYDQKVKKHLALRLLTVAATAIAVILFMLTEDMTLPMVFADKWTVWHIIIGAATTMLAIFSRKQNEDEELEADRA